MTKQELISRIESERAQLEEAISTLLPDQMVVAGAGGYVVGQWSVKDTLAHLALWTSRCVTLIFTAEQGQKPSDVDTMLEHGDALNVEDYESQKDRPLDRVISDFRGSHRQLLRRLSTWKDEMLNDRQRFPWLRGLSMGEFLTQQIADHDAEHRKQIEAWRAG
ncbi:MAG: ClbS/DfsB family four-helix bundle protein [Chloroflexi bacterium]|nr:ClbS/DfsB family four-helix bundle protein [Chloroflexota bacterium]